MMISVTCGCQSLHTIPEAIANVRIISPYDEHKSSLMGLSLQIHVTSLLFLLVLHEEHATGPSLPTYDGNAYQIDYNFRSEVDHQRCVADMLLLHAPTNTLTGSATLSVSGLTYHTQGLIPESGTEQTNLHPSSF